VESVDLPDGRSLELEVVRHPGGAAIVAVDGEGRVCLLRQYRHAAGGWLWEVPAGKLEPEEPPQATAERELAEEAGVRARRWESLGAIVMTPGFCDEVIHLFLARELETGAAAPGEHELIEVHWVPFTTALDRARSGELRDAKTLVGLFRAAASLGVAF
jgi:ADP-ribose pyrophosphatase